MFKILYNFTDIPRCGRALILGRKVTLDAGERDWVSAFE
jgi:hypothetical protein